MFPNLKRDSKQTLFLAPSNLHPCWILTCPYIPMTLEGGGTISQLSDVTAGKSCAAKGHSHFDECKTETINSPSTVYSLRTCDKDYCLFSESRVVQHESLSCPAGCPVERKCSIHLSCIIQPWGLLCPSLLMTMGSKIVEDFATALTQTAVFISFIFSLLDWETLWTSCASDSSNIHANQRVSNKSAVSGRLTTI